MGFILFFSLPLCPCPGPRAPWALHSSPSPSSSSSFSSIHFSTSISSAIPSSVILIHLPCPSSVDRDLRSFRSCLLVSSSSHFSFFVTFRPSPPLEHRRRRRQERHGIYLFMLLLLLQSSSTRRRRRMACLPFRQCWVKSHLFLKLLFSFIVLAPFIQRFFFSPGLFLT